MDRRKLLYSILKELQDGNEPKQTDYELDNEQWGEMLELIRDEGYAKSVTVQRGGIGNPVVYAWLNKAKITFKGIEYLEANNAMARLYSGL
ncbi:YjcQ family protein [Metabacillus sp. 113a]|uniref:YjcQ family protein n=1 Tax=Metabacillus sp. 113a TaxID=3404706 RepID=UPI003CE6EBFE